MTRPAPKSNSTADATPSGGRAQTLVEAILSQGIDVPFSCREGQCRSCASTLIAGEVDRGTAAILDQRDINAGVILGCQARPVSDKVEIEF